MNEENLTTRGLRASTRARRHDRRLASARRLLAALALALLVPLAVGCGGSSLETRDYDHRDPATRNREPATLDPGYYSSPQRYGGRYQSGNATGDSEAGAAFARWVIDQDPYQQYLTEAVVRGENTLGIKVKPTLGRTELQQLLPAMARAMAQEFPGHYIRVIAFDQPGSKLAEADYDPRSRDVKIAFGR